MRVAILRTDRFGETLLNMPLAAAIKRAHPDWWVSMHVHPAWCGVIGWQPVLDAVHAVPWTGWKPGWPHVWSLRAQLAAGQYDAVIVSNPNKYLHVAAALARIPQRIGYGRKWGWTLTAPMAQDQAAERQHEILRNLRLLRPLGIVGLPVDYRLPVDAQARDQAVRKWPVLRDSAARVVAVHPFSTDPRKRWPAERFGAVLQRWAAAETQLTCVVVGSEEDRAAGRELCDQLGPCALNLVGQTSVAELAAVLAHSRLLLCNDSGPMHLAAAVGTTVVALMAAARTGGQVERWRPWGDQHVLVTGEMVGDIPPDDVVAAVQRQMRWPASAC